MCVGLPLRFKAEISAQRGSKRQALLLRTRTKPRAPAPVRGDSRYVLLGRLLAIPQVGEALSTFQPELWWPIQQAREAISDSNE